MSMQINLHDGFQLNEEIWHKVEEAAEKGWKSFTLLSNGTVINSVSELKVLFGPVVGEVTDKSVIILIEVDCDKTCLNLECKLYEKGVEDPVDVIEKEVTKRRPQSFSFDNLSPDTKYCAWFGTSPTPTFASFKTKKLEMDNFKMIALSCDKPARLLLGQLNPWKFIGKAVKKGQIDTVLHLGDQIYPDGEDIASAAKIFAENFDDMDESKQEDMMNRGRELWRQKYRSYFNRYE